VRRSRARGGGRHAERGSAVMMRTQQADGRSDEFDELKTCVENPLSLLPNPVDPDRWKPARHEPYFLITVNGQTLRFTWRESI
jgi:hypothetical protein